jgi:prepilin-type N-terminal cleavage/methylation domain-containing protein
MKTIATHAVTYPLMPSRRGFSLVELSIVLVILGLLVGGVLSGQSLIRAAEIRAVSTEYERYVAATYSFRDKYFALPGDLNNSSSFWPAAANGDGDGILDVAPAASVAGERFGFWQQLALAGLIEGSFSGLTGSGSTEHSVIGTNIPKSRLGNAGWSAKYVAEFTINTAAGFEGSYGNYLEFGAPLTNGTTINPILKPEDAWNIDTKTDDGLPGLGKVRV